MKLNPKLINDVLHVPPTTEQKLKLFTAVRDCLVRLWKSSEANTHSICDALHKAQRDLGFMIDYSSDSPYYGCTHVIWSRSGRSDGYGFGNNMETNFPELLKFKPRGKEIVSYWWSTDKNSVYGQKRRIAVCDKIIAVLQEEINNNK